MSATRPAEELRKKAAEVIMQKLKEVTVAQAANDLGVSRQAIYGFKNGEYCPSLAVIQKACRKWGLEFKIQGFTEEVIVNERSFPQTSGSTFEKTEQQTSMFDLWEQLGNRRMTVVRAERVDGAVEMTLRIEIPA